MEIDVVKDRLPRSTGPALKTSEDWVTTIPTSSFCVDAWTADHAWDLAEKRVRKSPT